MYWWCSSSAKQKRSQMLGQAIDEKRWTIEGCVWKWVLSILQVDPINRTMSGAQFNKTIEKGRRSRGRGPSHGPRLFCQKNNRIGFNKVSLILMGGTILNILEASKLCHVTHQGIFPNPLGPTLFILLSCLWWCCIIDLDLSRFLLSLLR